MNVRSCGDVEVALLLLPATPVGRLRCSLVERVPWIRRSIQRMLRGFGLDGKTGKGCVGLIASDRSNGQPVMMISDRVPTFAVTRRRCLREGGRRVVTTRRTIGRNRLSGIVWRGRHRRQRLVVLRQ